MNPTVRYTRKQSLRLALFNTGQMLVLPVGLISIAVALHLDRYLDPTPITHSVLTLTLAVVSSFLFVAITFVGYLDFRSKPTQDEVRENDRRRFNALMLRYPEFQTAHQRKIEDAADDLLDKLEALAVNIPEMKALRDALTWR